MEGHEARSVTKAFQTLGARIEELEMELTMAQYKIERLERENAGHIVAEQKVHDFVEDIERMVNGTKEA